MPCDRERTQEGNLIRRLLDPVLTQCRYAGIDRLSNTGNRYGLGDGNQFYFTRVATAAAGRRGHPLPYLLNPLFYPFRQACPFSPPAPTWNAARRDPSGWRFARSSAIPSNRNSRRQFGQTFSDSPIGNRQCGQVAAIDLFENTNSRNRVLSRLIDTFSLPWHASIRSFPVIVNQLDAAKRSGYPARLHRGPGV